MDRIGGTYLSFPVRMMKSKTIHTTRSVNSTVFLGFLLYFHHLSHRAPVSEFPPINVTSNGDLTHINGLCNSIYAVQPDRLLRLSITVQLLAQTVLL